jgi:serine/threonine-protein kinase HipA
VIEASLGRPDLTEVDYLLHAGQEHVSALTFGLSATPPAPVRAFNRVVDLAELSTAAATILAHDSPAAAIDAALSRLLEAPGTSMGGARPKSIIRDGGRLWIAKFPHAADRWNVASVEGRSRTPASRPAVRHPDSRCGSP